MLWLPDDGILFSGDVLVEDGVTMVIDGSSRELLACWMRSSNCTRR